MVCDECDVFLVKSRSGVTYCPDVIEARFSKVCGVRSKSELTVHHVFLQYLKVVVQQCLQDQC